MLKKHYTIAAIGLFLTFNIQSMESDNCNNLQQDNYEQFLPEYWLYTLMLEKYSLDAKYDQKQNKKLSARSATKEQFKKKKKKNNRTDGFMCDCPVNNCAMSFFVQNKSNLYTNIKKHYVRKHYKHIKSLYKLLKNNTKKFSFECWQCSEVLKFHSGESISNKFRKLINHMASATCLPLTSYLDSLNIRHID